MHKTRRLLIPAILALLVGLGFLFGTDREAQSDSVAERELAKAVERGKELWTTTFARGGKTCATCHTRGPNRMTGARLHAWPRYDDKGDRKVTSAQQKINQMIKKFGRGEPLELGSDDLNALEAYIKTLE